MPTREVEAAMKAVEKEFAEKMSEAFAGDGVAFRQTVYKDPRQSLNVRLEAAAKAAPFERPMLSASNVRVINSFEDLTREELERLAAAEETGPRADRSETVALRTIHEGRLRCEADQTIALLTYGLLTTIPYEGQQRSG